MLSVQTILQIIILKQRLVLPFGLEILMNDIFSRFHGKNHTHSLDRVVKFIYVIIILGQINVCGLLVFQFYDQLSLIFG